MSDKANDIISRVIADEEKLANIAVETLEMLVQQYPHYSAAQFALMLKQLPATDKDILGELTLQNISPLWFAFLSDESIGTSEAFILPVDTQQPVLNEEVNIDHPAVASTITTTEQVAQPQQTATPDISLAPSSPSNSATPAMSVKKTKLMDLLNAPLDITAASKISFEPYHTIDYFASLGIELKEDIMPKDRMSRQLKSFTDWLKVMKQLPESAQTNGRNENKVTQLAAISLSESSIYTESMAEVWIKQGNPAEAKKIYEKLSLLEPAKSSYFASKIENLKN